jgi:glycosyltransferase involved in cell wall biosynthesis
MSAFISIIVPAFNRGFIIRRALDSILEQTYQDWEALVVNDGSTDDTSEVVREYARKDSRIQLLEHDRQKGAQAARNTGLRAAKGQWIAFLDSDDRWLPHSLEARLKRIGNGLYQVVHSDCYILSPGSDNLERFGVPRMEGWVYQELLRRPGPMFQALLVSKKALTDIGFLDEKIVSYQEWDTAIRLARYCSYEFIPEPTFIYDCRHANTISKNSCRGALGYEQVFTKHVWSILRYLGPRAVASHYQQAASVYWKAKDESNANRCLLRVIMWWPLFGFAPLSRRARRLLKLMSCWAQAHRNSS